MALSVLRGGGFVQAGSPITRDAFQPHGGGLQGSVSRESHRSKLPNIQEDPMGPRTLNLIHKDGQLPVALVSLYTLSYSLLVGDIYFD